MNGAWNLGLHTHLSDSASNYTLLQSPLTSKGQVTIMLTHLPLSPHVPLIYGSSEVELCLVPEADPDGTLLRAKLYERKRRG